MTIQKVFRPLHPSWIFYACVIGVIIGTVLGFALELPTLNAIWLIPACLLLGLALWRSTYFFIILAFLTGIIFAIVRISPEIEARATFSALIGQTVTITGTITSDPQIDSSGTAFSLGQLEHSSGTLYVKISGTHEELERFDKITVSGNLGSGFGTFVGSLYRPTIISLAKLGSGNIIVRLKTWFKETLQERLPSPAVDLGLGYLMGDKSGLSDEINDALRATGMSHIVVASGAHLAIIISIIGKIFGRLSKFASLMFSLLTIGIFVLIVGFTPSITRAAIVTVLSILAGYVGRKFSPFRLLSFVAAATLLISPTNIFNLGWQLSFAAFAGILLITPIITTILYGGKKPPWLAAMLITSFATSLLCAPILIYNFGTISLLSFVANLVILPTLPYAMLFVFLTGILGFLPFLAGIFAKFAEILLNFHIFLINFLSTKTMFIMELPTGQPQVFLAYIPIAILICYNTIYVNYRKHHQSSHRYRYARVWEKTGSEP